MAAILSSLFLILSLWMTGSRSALVFRSESPGSSSLWDRDHLNIVKRALAFRKAGNNPAAQSLYMQGYEAAMAQRQTVSAVRYLISAGGCQFLDYHYDQALATFLRTRDMAESAGDSADAAIIAFNLSSIYLHVWDLPSAVHAAQDGIAALDKSRGGQIRAALLLQIGRLHSLLRDAASEPFYLDGIEAARSQGLDSMEAIGWDLLGEQLMSEQRLDRAEQALGQAFRLRTFSPLKLQGELPFSYVRLGELKLAQGDLRTALRFTEQALARRNTVSWPLHVLLEQRGRIRLELGETEAALTDLSSALDSATAWRAEVPAARSSLTGATIALEKRIFDSFIEAAAGFAIDDKHVDHRDVDDTDVDHQLDRKNPQWAAKAFQAAELNRAANLRQSLALAPVWREKLPPKYWELLGQVAETERLSRFRPEAAVRLRRLHLEITEMEAKAGLGFAVKKDENFTSRASLIHFQEGLSDSELFLSFFLGKRESYLWAVSRTSLRMFRLPGGRGPTADQTAPVWAGISARVSPRRSPAVNRAEDLTGDLTGDVQSYRQALLSSGTEQGRAEAVRTGRRLYQRLFGQLGAQEKSKTAWLLSLDGALFDIPFAALVAEQQGGKIVYLVEQHSLQIVPGALALWTADTSAAAAHGYLPSKHSPTQPAFDAGWFLGVGDPIYNRADPRWQAAGASLTPVRAAISAGALLTGAFFTTRKEFGSSGDAVAGQELERLVGSGGEVESSAAAWRQGTGAATVLTGMDARRDRFVDLLRAGPRVIHLATHAIIPSRDREQGSVAFSLTDGRTSQFLTAPEIAMLHVPQALVVMTGCETGAGQVRSGAGLLGLTRAWLMAGASGVLATEWPVEDTSGDMFSGFYRRLRTTSAAEALRQTQIELAHEGSWRSAPVNWASYQLTGPVRLTGHGRLTGARR